MAEMTSSEVQRLVALADDLRVNEVRLGSIVFEVVGRARADSYNSGTDDEEMGLVATDDNEADALKWYEAYHKRAREINNQGAEAQVHFLVEQLGAAYVEEVIRELVSGSPFAFRLPLWG